MPPIEIALFLTGPKTKQNYVSNSKSVLMLCTHRQLASDPHFYTYYIYIYKYIYCSVEHRQSSSMLE